MNILGIDSLEYGAESPDDTVKFYLDWGLDPIGETATGTELGLADGTTILIHAADDPNLPPALIDWEHLGGSTVRRVIWGVDSASTLDEIRSELTTDREVSTVADGTLHTTDNHGYHIGFRVSRRRETKAEPPKTNSAGRSPRRNVPAEGATRNRAKPLRFGHIVYWARGELKEAVGFYTDRLGFRITDNMIGGGTFMRCAGATDHHNLLLQRGGDYLGFQHVAFEFRDFDAVMMLGVHMEGQGWRTNVGPLRHNIGSSMSWYIWNPGGGLAEAFCDMDYADDDWVVRNINPKDPSFYGHSWNARPEQAGRRPADLHDD